MPRHLQNALGYNAQAFSKIRAISFTSKNKSIRCDWSFGSTKIFKSIYCFKKNDSKSATFNIVLSPSIKFKKSKKDKKKGRYTVYLPLKNWGLILFN